MKTWNVERAGRGGGAGMIFLDIMDYLLIKISFQILMLGEVGRVGRGRGSPKEFEHVQF